MPICGLILVFLILLTGVSPASPGRIQILGFDPRALPPGIHYQGKVVAGARWVDQAGENLLLLCETGYFQSRVSPRSRENPYQEPGWAAALYGYHYVKTKDKFALLWKLSDFIKICPFDLELAFLPNSLTITDLDQNGIAESTFLYKLACRGDVSPAQLKLIMHEGKAKYALRGETLVNIGQLEGGPPRKIGGKHTVDPAFNRAPKVFLNHALQQWNAFVEERFGN